MPTRVERVIPAGPPAATMLYTLAPDLLLGWPRANRPQECAYMLPDICTRPEVGWITGRGNTANLETVSALRPDLIVDVGSTSETSVSLAARVQDQTGIPYALLDGRFDGAGLGLSKPRSAYRPTGRRGSGGDYTHRTLTAITGRIANVRTDHRPRVYHARGPRGLETGLGGSINVETIELIARNVAGGTPARARECFDRAGAAVEPGCDRHHRPGIFRRRAQ